jgi:hypothetical protein
LHPVLKVIFDRFGWPGVIAWLWPPFKVLSSQELPVHTGYGLLIGRNTGTPVSHDYKVPFSFTATLKQVTIETK